MSTSASTTANTNIPKDSFPLPIRLYGRPSCEATAAVRARLDQIGAPYAEFDVDQDPDAAEFIENLNQGWRKTPVLVFGNQQYILIEPALEELNRFLRRAGYQVDHHEMDHV